MALVKEIIETRPNGEVWYDLHSDTEGKCVRQIETGVLYGGVAMLGNDPYTYEEADDPNYDPETENREETETVDAEIQNDLPNDGMGPNG